MTTASTSLAEAKLTRFTASREQPCSGCDGVVVKGSRGGYAAGAKVLCQDCCGGPDKAAPPALCTCSDRRVDGFTRGVGGRWVHAGCGLPAHLTGDELEDAEAEAWVAGETSVLDQPIHLTKEIARDPTPAAGPAPAGDAAPAKRKRRTRRQPDTGEQAGPAGSPVRPAEAAGGRDNGAAEGDHRRDQGGAGEPAAGGGDIHSADQPPPARAAAVEAQADDAARREGDQGGDAGDSVAAVGRDEQLVGTEGGGLSTVTNAVTTFAPIMSAFYAQAAPVSVAHPTINGNTTFAVAYAREMREIVERHANGSARNLQRSLGPSEIGHSCHRQVAGKLAQLPTINHVGDPWASIMGTAGHAWMEEALSAVNPQLGYTRFLTEHRVTPLGFEDHPGTGDGYDALHNAVIDHKFLGDTSMGKLKQHGAPRHYFVQTLLYARGFARLGLPVERVMLLAWPRTRSTLDAMYVWEHEITDEDQAFLDEVIAPELAYRKQWAVALLTGAAQLHDVPMDTEDECQWCPFYRPASARDGLPGCPGHTAGR